MAISMTIFLHLPGHSFIHAFYFIDSLSQHKGTEWLGEDESRLVVVRIKRQSKIEVINLKGKPLRSINLAGMKPVHGWFSSNKKRDVVLLRVPKEYDLVSRFE